MISSDLLLGKTKDHLVPLEGTKFLVHREMLPQFLSLQAEASKHGFSLEIASAFRDYERQLRIWNDKASGKRPLMDSDGNPLDFASLSPTQIMFAILRWSAVPGFSRHHWGTDIDVFDRKTQAPDEVKLHPSECEGYGPAAALHEWLDHNLASFDFYRPYRSDRGGVAPERWHLSYAPLSLKYASEFSPEMFKQLVSGSHILLKEELLANADEIFQRFFLNVDPP